MSCAVTLTLSDPLLRAARDVASAREITLQQLLKDALATELARARRQASSPVRADERFISMLRARLVGDFAAATDWFDLQHRLLKKGVRLREAGGGLALFVAHDGARLCKASDMGYSLNTLARRFGAPFPGEKMGRRNLHAVTAPAWRSEVLDREIDV